MLANEKNLEEFRQWRDIINKELDDLNKKLGKPNKATDEPDAFDMLLNDADLLDDLQHSNESKAGINVREKAIVQHAKQHSSGLVIIPIGETHTKTLGEALSGKVINFQNDQKLEPIALALVEQYDGNISKLIKDLTENTLPPPAKSRGIP